MRYCLLRPSLGFAVWQTDVLQRTFTTHHLIAFRNYAELPQEKVHRSAELLRTRFTSPWKAYTAARIPTGVL